MEHENAKVFRKAEDKPQKKPYAAPQLMIHGTVDKLTKGAGITPQDGLAGSIL